MSDSPKVSNEKAPVLSNASKEEEKGEEDLEYERKLLEQVDEVQTMQSKLEDKKAAILKKLQEKQAKK